MAIDLSQIPLAFAALDKAWKLQDPSSRTFYHALSDARAMAASGKWEKTPIAYANVRALAASTSLSLRGLLPDARPDDPQSDRWGAALHRSWKIIAERAGYKGEDAQTVAKGAQSTAAFPIIEVVAIVLGAIVVVTVLYFVISHSAEVVDNQLARGAEEEELVRLHSEADKVVSDHLAREKLAGKPIPWSQAELDVLDRLERLEAQIIHGLEPKPSTGGIGTFGAGAFVGALLLAGLGYYAWKGSPS